jgi:O-antigen ligase
MLLAAALTAFFAPLALTPRLLFYYDITPKIAFLLLGAAIALALTFKELDSLRAFCGTPYGRLYAAATGAAIGLAGVATLFSAHPGLAWNGSTWRRMGGMTECAILLAALWIAAYALRSPERMAWLLRAVCAAGLLSAIYGIAQYFGWDPLLQKSGYEAGEGIYRIVRPPGTLGHSDYFAAFLLWPIFAGIGLWRDEKERAFKMLGAAATAAGIMAILLSGSRGAVLGLVAGVCVLAAAVRPSVRAVATTAALVAVALGAFYVSPGGERMRARAHWIGEDRVGGARPLLWRDSLKMAAAKPLVGFGLDTFVAEFPHYQSEELARQYPDFYHESPHNIFLDALTAEGVPGLLILVSIIAAGLSGAVIGGAKSPLLPGLVASLMAHQFIVFIAPTAFYFYLGAALLAGHGASRLSPSPVPALWRRATLAGGLAAATFLGVITYRMVAADSALATAQRKLDANDPRGAAEAYRKALSRSGPDATADLYFSRRWATVAASAPDTMSKLYFGQIAAGAASLATKSPEQLQNAWYNLAVLEASSNNAAAVEYGLRASIAAAPVWYKPHWSLARLLVSEGRRQEAEPEARRALYLDGEKDHEVVSTMHEILGSRDARP